MAKIYINALKSCIKNAQVDLLDLPTLYLLYLAIEGFIMTWILIILLSILPTHALQRVELDSQIHPNSPLGRKLRSIFTKKILVRLQRKLNASKYQHLFDQNQYQKYIAALTEYQIIFEDSGLTIFEGSDYKTFIMTHETLPQYLISYGKPNPKFINAFTQSSLKSLIYKISDDHEYNYLTLYKLEKNQESNFWVYGLLAGSLIMSGILISKMNVIHWLTYQNNMWHLYNGQKNDENKALCEKLLNDNEMLHGQLFEFISAMNANTERFSGEMGQLISDLHNHDAGCTSQCHTNMERLRCCHGRFLYDD